MYVFLSANKVLHTNIGQMKKYKFTVQFRLEKRKDTPKDKDGLMINAQILADITFESKRIFYYVGYRIDESKWINDKAADGTRIQQVKKNTVNKRGESASEINARLCEIKQAVENVFHRLGVNEIQPTTNVVRDELKKELDEEATLRKTVVESYNQFIEEESIDSTWASATKAMHRTTLSHLQGFKSKLYFEDMTEETLNAFVRHLTYECNLSNPSTIKNVKNIRWFMSWATKRGYNKTTDYQMFSPKLKGVSTSDKTNIIALTIEEYNHLFNLPIESPCLQRVRDIFCFCAATTLRYSDVNNLRWSNVKENAIEIVTIKTDDPLIIDLNDYSRALIEKYRPYKDLEENGKVFPVISNQKYNDYIKEMGKLAGFNQPTTKVTYKGAERIEKTVPKYELLTSHVARKTAVTILLYLGVPAEVVRAWTGHTDAKTMEKYFRFSDQQKSKQMQKFNMISDVAIVKTVFDYAITDAERAILDIEEKDGYIKQVESDKDLAMFDIVRLLQRRGDTQEMMASVQKLSVERMQEFFTMNGIFFK